MRFIVLTALVVASASVAAAQQASPKGGDNVVPEPITITGCVAAGEKKNTYMLSNIMRSPANGQVNGAHAADIYWLDSPGKLKGHVGKRVEVIGMVKEDTDKTKVTEKDGKVTTTTERTKDVTVDSGSAAGEAAKSLGKNVNHTSLNVKVKSVREIPGTCDQ